MIKILRFLDKYKVKAIAGLVFKLIAAVLELTIPLIMSYIVNNMFILPPSKVVLYCCLILLIVLINYSFDIACQYFASVSSAGIGQEIRRAIYSKVNKLSYSEIDKLGSSSLITRTTNDVTQIQQAVAMGIRLLSRAPFLTLGAIGMAMLINFKIALIFLVVLVVVFLIILFIRKKTVPMYGKVQTKLDKITSKTKENLEGIRVSRAFNMQEDKSDDFRMISQNYSNSILKVNKFASLLSPLTYLIINLTTVLVVYIGGKMVGEQKLLDGDILALVSYLMQVLLALNVISNLIVIYTRAGASAKRVQEVLDTENSIKEYPIDVADTSMAQIVLKNVNFSYKNSGKNSLENINLTIEKGERIGIIGGTGQGKSTLINLLPRYYDVSEGEIFVNGKNVRFWATEELNRYIRVTPQNTALLNGTISENILIGKRNASVDQIVRAAEIAEADEFIENLDGKYEKIIEQEGRNFSGGQKQRLSLARAFVSDFEILIIDDSLSALDMLTDLKVRKNIDENFKDKTVIFVSQRVSTLKNCDRILVMEKGRITAIGNHNQLMEESLLYSEIARSQSGL